MGCRTNLLKQKVVMYLQIMHTLAATDGFGYHTAFLQILHLASTKRSKRSGRRIGLTLLVHSSPSLPWSTILQSTAPGKSGVTTGAISDPFESLKTGHDRYAECNIQ